MDFTQWSQLALICVMGAMSPGPSLAVILRNTISGGRTQGLMSGVGHGIGITFYSVVNFFLLAQIIGSLFLILLGSKMIISGIGGEQDNGELKQSTITGYHGFSDGFLIAFLNPKIAVWLLALFSQFVQPDADFTEQLVMVLTVGGVDTSWYCLVAFLASSRGLVKALQRNAKRIDLIMGLLLILLAGGMLWRAFTLLS